MKFSRRNTNKIISSFIAVLLISVMVIGIAPNLAVKVEAAYENTHNNTGNQIDDILAVAETQVGYSEGSNNNTKYGAWYPMNYNPWCAMFVSWCANQAGISTSIIPKHASCDVGMNWFKNQGRWQNSAYYGGSYTPKAGDIIYFGVPGDSNHVGIVRYVSGGYVYTVEGNTSDMVKNKSYSLNNSTILGYGLPAYTQNRRTLVGCWISDKQGGQALQETGKTIQTGEYVYFVYQIKDGNSGDSFDSYNTVGYTAKITIYNPDGSVALSETYSKDNGSIGVYANYPGTYKGELILSMFDGTYKVMERTTIVTQNRQTLVGCWMSDKQGGQALQETGKTIQAGDYVYFVYQIKDGFSGASFDSYNTVGYTAKITIYNPDGSVARTETYSKDNGSIGVYANYPGTYKGELILSMNDGTYKVMERTTTVSAPSYTISYNANGGSGAPSSQTKQYNSYVYLSSNSPTRSNYVFTGWNTRSDGTGVSYDPGEYYSANYGLTLYAQWTHRCNYYGHNYSNYSVTTMPTTTSTGWILGTCTYCSNTNSVKLPVLSTSDYYYFVNIEPTYEHVGMGIYEWHNTKYGNFSFTVEIPKLDNVFSYSISHWASGFKNNEGTNSSQTSVSLNHSEYSSLYGSTFLLSTNLGLSVPNGYYLDSKFGTSSISSGTWEYYSMGTWVTQKPMNMHFEYYYKPIEYSITYRLNGGTNSPKNPTTYTVLYGISLYEPEKEGYLFTGWIDSSGNAIKGINKGKNGNFATNATYSQFCDELAKRTTGNITLTATWVKIGDINGDNSVDISDALTLFMHSMLPSQYPINYVGIVDFNGDGYNDISDALLLFMHSMLPDQYPLN